MKLADARELVAFLTEADDEVAALYDAEALVPKGRSLADAATALQAARDALAELTAADFAADVLEGRCRAQAERLGLEGGRFLPPAAHRHHRTERVAATVRLDGAAGP